jgi:cytochrome c oxidase assembly protein subunit 15
MPQILKETVTRVDHSDHHPWLHRIAVLTACLALLPILMGALVTTKDAGMAFPDWPSSDGHNMLLYPWLKSAGAKFLEHGHRLAGILIGIASIGLAVAAHRLEQRLWVRLLAYGVLVAVITQGILGGQRVLLDQRGLAFVHGSFAALVLALMASVAVITSRNWNMTPFSRDETSEIPASKMKGPKSEMPGPRRLQLLALCTCGCVFIQYILGGLLRHQGKVLFEHLGFAIVAAVMVIWLAMAAVASGSAWLRGPAISLAALTIMQLALGAGAWITKFGFDDYVAVYGSLEQVTMRTAHVLCGMLLFATCVVLTVRIARLQRLSMGGEGWPGLERSEAPAGEESWRGPNQGNPIANRLEFSTQASIMDVDRAGSPPGLRCAPAPATRNVLPLAGGAR